MPLAYAPQHTTIDLPNATSRPTSAADEPQEESHRRNCRGVPARGRISQERLSAECGFERTYLSRVERGILNPTAIRVWTIADALKVPFHEMIHRMENWLSDQPRSRS